MQFIQKENSYLYYVETFLKETLCVAIVLHSVNKDVEKRKQGKSHQNYQEQQED